MFRRKLGANADDPTIMVPDEAIDGARSKRRQWPKTLVTAHVPSGEVTRYIAQVTTPHKRHGTEVWVFVILARSFDDGSMPIALY